MSIRFVSTALLLAALVGCGGDSSDSSQVLSPDELPPGDVTFGVTHVMTKNGVRTAILKADTAVQLDNGRRLDLRQVDLQFFEESGAESGTLTSRTGEYTPADGSFIARDSVVLITRTEDGTRKVETEELFYDTRTEQVWSDSAFVMTQAGKTTRGSSFRSDVGGTNWTAKGLEADDIATGAEFTF